MAPEKETDKKHGKDKEKENDKKGTPQDKNHDKKGTPHDKDKDKKGAPHDKNHDKKGTPHDKNKDKKPDHTAKDKKAGHPNKHKKGDQADKKKEEPSEKDKDKHEQHDDKPEDETPNVEDDQKKVDEEKEDQQFLEYAGEQGKRLFSKRVMQALQPIMWFSMLSGHWPLVYKEASDGSFKFKYNPWTIQGAFFFFILFLSFFTFFTTAVNYIYMSMELEILPGEKSPTFREERWYEVTLFKREIIWQMSMTCAMIQSCFATLHIFLKRNYMASIYTFYTRVVQQLHMDISDGVFTTVLLLVVIYFCTTLGIILMGILHFAPVTTGSPTLFGIFVFRQFAEWDGLWIKEPNSTRTAVQILGAITMIMIMNSAKIQIFAFVYHCKLLRNAFATWNGRVYVTIMKGGKYISTEEGRTTFVLLYKDHCILLDMLEGTNRLFSTIIESYFACQILAIFLELYFFLRAGNYGFEQTQGALGGGTYFIRPQDYIPAGLLLAQSSIILYIAAKAGSAVGEEAKVGTDILRRKSMINRKTDAELLFQLSMDASYNAFLRMDISGGGYSYIDKEWLLALGHNLAGYFVIVYQFAPTLDRKTLGDWEKRRAIGNFLTSLEYLDNPLHWQSTPAPLHPTYPP